MRNLPSKKTEYHKRIINATYDFFGDMNPEERRSAKRIALWIMGRKRGNKLTEGDFTAVWHIRNNLSDKTYCGNELQ